VTGNLVADVLEFHEKYGDVIRLIFANRGGHAPFPKNPIWFKAPPGQPDNMVTTVDYAANQRMRKVLAPAFTERAIYQQEPIVQSYVHLLMSQLYNIASSTDSREKGATVNFTDWFNFYAFDVIGDLSLGESFDCLKDSRFHLWVAMIFNHLKGEQPIFFLISPWSLNWFRYGYRSGYPLLSSARACRDGTPSCEGLGNAEAALPDFIKQNTQAHEF
jgi:cytochrome P450